MVSEYCNSRDMYDRQLWLLPPAEGLVNFQIDLHLCFMEYEKHGFFLTWLILQYLTLMDQVSQ